ncbi:type II toxin-antitoxin system VapC family toxin [Haloferula sargassicola]|uniref:Ribonuclease VapC n=1 Tax=Haloferula sargassicola TaxID=490096 RepID=A0ABP9UQ21_9BACT
MLHLDTNVLIDLSSRQSTIADTAASWLQAGESLACASVTWTEFCNGPCNEEQRSSALSLIEDRISDFTRHDAEFASELFNATGRRRGSVIDCMIAACAIAENARLATFNLRDFQPFEPHGLRLQSLT